MIDRNIAAILLDGIRVLHCVYRDGPGQKTYAFITDRDDVAVGDTLVVPNEQNCFGMALVKVVRVGVPEINQPFKYGTILCKVGMGESASLQAKLVAIEMAATKGYQLSSDAAHAGTGQPGAGKVAGPA